MRDDCVLTWGSGGREGVRQSEVERAGLGNGLDVGREGKEGIKADS